MHKGTDASNKAGGKEKPDERVKHADLPEWCLMFISNCAGQNQVKVKARRR